MMRMLTMLLEMVVMLMSDLPFVDDVKKGESYLEGELGERYFVTLIFCHILLCWTSCAFTCTFILCCGHGYVYLLFYVFVSCMRLISFIYDMT